MTSSELRQKYFDFFESKGHKLIPNVSLIPENDPSALFISAGMHPLVPYLLGETHPLGKRLVSIQRCLRTGDIDEVGDAVHHTFFEMLGNWSLGDYFKKEMIPWSLEFLTSDKYLGLAKEKLAVTVFAGDSNAPFDQESFDIWQSLGISDTRIAKLPKKNNWWGPAGQTGPCGPDTEMFYWIGKEPAPAVFNPEDSEWVEIWNDVFMEFNKKEDGLYKPLRQKNVDTGMGLERTLAVLNGLDDNYKTDLFWPIIQRLEELSGKKYDENNKEFRIIADHFKAAVFLARDQVKPSNKLQGYVMRRLIRRSVVKMLQINIVPIKAVPVLCQEIFNIYNDVYFDEKRLGLSLIVRTEIDSFLQTIGRGTRILQTQKEINGKVLFDLYQSYGFPLEISLELLNQWGTQQDQEKLKSEFFEEQKKHQELSKTTSSGIFKGGLADQSETVTKYHTATHLLQAALRKVLGEEGRQKGSNITSERLRFDFSHSEKVTAEQLLEIEKIVNDQIGKNVQVEIEMMDFEKAIQSGALIVPNEHYPEKVKVYSIEDFSKEVCGGPHVDFTGKLGKFKIIREENAGSGIRRIYAVLE